MFIEKLFCFIDFLLEIKWAPRYTRIIFDGKQHWVQYLRINYRRTAFAIIVYVTALS